MSTQADAHANDIVQVPRGILQMVLDAAYNGDVAASGRLVDEEVEALRAVAVLLNIDPLDVTPDHYRCKYAGHVVSRNGKLYVRGTTAHCFECGAHLGPASSFQWPETCPSTREGAYILPKTPDALFDRMRNKTKCTLAFAHAGKHSNGKEEWE